MGELTSETFGLTPAGEPATLYTLTNAHGMTARISDYGATLVQLHVPTAAGGPVDVVGGFDTLEEYASSKNAVFGATIGPVANRIGQAGFTLDGQHYALTANHGRHTLHGGGAGAFHRVRWAVEAAEARPEPALRLTYTHADGVAGFPGNLRAGVTYTLTHDNMLRLDYVAYTDQRTPVNLTNHSYFNLAGHDHGTVADHVLWLNADRYTPTDADLIPTGAIEPVQGTALDFTERKLIGDGLAALEQQGVSGGFDNNFMVNKGPGEMGPVAQVHAPATGLVMDVRSTQPCVQLYTGGNLYGQTGKGGATYSPQSLLCLETQHPPDAVNHANFPATLLEPGGPYHHTAEFRFAAS